MIKLSFLEGKNILVTGGAGFIGSNFIRFILNNYKDVEFRLYNLDVLTYAGNLSNLIDIHDDSRYYFIYGDIANEDFIYQVIGDLKIDVIINFAAESHVDRSILSPHDFIRTNVYGTFTLLDVARKLWKEEDREEKLFLHISTDEVFGDLEIDDPPFTETTPYKPSSPYSASKASSDHFVRAYGRTYKLPINITNCSNNYGPYQFPEKLIPTVISKILKDEYIPIYGTGENIRDWIYVDDHNRGVLYVIEKGVRGQSYNIGARNEKTNLEIVHKICDIMDEKLNREIGTSRKLIRFVNDRPGHDKRYAMDPTKIETTLGWMVGVDFENGIRKTIDWYLSNQKWIDDILTGNYKEKNNKILEELYEKGRCIRF